MYSPGETCQLTNIPPSTLRRYVAEFGEHLSPSARKLRGREFDDRDISILVQVRDLAQSGLTLNKIGEQLSETIEHEPAGESEPPAQTALMIINRIGQQLESVSGQLSAVQADQSEQRSEIEQLKTQLEQLSAELQAERNKSIWDRIRGR